MIKQALKQVLPSELVEAYRVIRLGFRSRDDLSAATPRAIRNWVGLCRTVRKVLPDSFPEASRFFQLDRLVREIDRDGIPGDIVECGVYRGGGRRSWGVRCGIRGSGATCGCLIPSSVCPRRPSWTGRRRGCLRVILLAMNST
jgi:hypothetical protein